MFVGLEQAGTHHECVTLASHMARSSAPITEAAVWDALRQVEDPDLKQDLVSLNMVRDLRIAGNRVAFTVVLTTPACPMKDMIQNACVTAVKTLVSQDAEVDVTMTADTTRGNTAQTGTALDGIRNIVAVASGKGGVGKSTVAVNLAAALAAEGAQVGLVDADIYGPSLPTLLGLVGQQPPLKEVNGQNRMVPLEAHGLKVNSIGFLVPPGQAIVWRGPMASKALTQLFTDTLWGALDYLIVDLPPGTGDVQITVSQGVPLTGAVIVTTPQEVALADVRKAIAMFQAPPVNVPILGVVENMAWFETPELPGRRFHLFGDGGGQAIAAEYQLPLLAQIPLSEATREGGDSGTPAVVAGIEPTAAVFRTLGKAVAQQVAIHNAQPRQQSVTPYPA